MTSARTFVEDICFGNDTLDGCLDALDKLLERFRECRISVSFIKSILVQSRLNFLSHEVTDEGLRPDTKKMKALKYEYFTYEGKLSVAKRRVATLQQKVGVAPLLQHFDRAKPVHGATLMHEHDGKSHPVRFCVRDLNNAEMNYLPVE
ncbi:hypothetical protein PHMEG_00013758 [Phytophthora megakarya]|uniref:Reverse transcriptase n=1 Tax=Phytophthora megakarya TaxID=4795 RepID=A0A225W5K2_9STRA|nr:hypothetical protein PHMEG_00013758 [Phytophthora megakarya]